MNTEDSDLLVLLGNDSVRQFAFIVEVEFLRFITCASQYSNGCSAIIFPPLRSRYSEVLLRLAEWFGLQIETHGWGEQRCSVIFYDNSSKNDKKPYCYRISNITHSANNYIYNGLQLSDYFPSSNVIAIPLSLSSCQKDTNDWLTSSLSISSGPESIVNCTSIQSSTGADLEKSNVSSNLRQHGRGSFMYTPSWLQTNVQNESISQVDSSHCDETIASQLPLQKVTSVSVSTTPVENANFSDSLASRELLFTPSQDRVLSCSLDQSNSPIQEIISTFSSTLTTDMSSKEYSPATNLRDQQDSLTDNNSTGDTKIDNSASKDNSNTVSTPILPERRRVKGLFGDLLSHSKDSDGAAIPEISAAFRKGSWKKSLAKELVLEERQATQQCSGYNDEIIATVKDITSHLNDVQVIPLEHDYQKYLKPIQNPHSNQMNFETSTFKSSNKDLSRRTFVRNTPRRSESHSLSTSSSRKNNDGTLDWDTAPDWHFDDGLYNSITSDARLQKTLSCESKAGGLRFQIEGTGRFSILFSTAETLLEGMSTRSQMFSWKVDFLIEWTSTFIKNVSGMAEENSKKRGRRKGKKELQPAVPISKQRYWTIRVLRPDCMDPNTNSCVNDSVKVPFRSPTILLSNFWVTVKRRLIEAPIDGFACRKRALVETMVTVGQGEFPRNCCLTATWTSSIEFYKIENYFLASVSAKSDASSESSSSSAISPIQRSQISFCFGWGSVLSYLASSNKATRPFHNSKEVDMEKIRNVSRVEEVNDINDFSIRSVFKLGRLIDRKHLPRRDHIIEIVISGWPSSPSSQNHETIVAPQNLQEGNGGIRRAGVGAFHFRSCGSWREAVIRSFQLTDGKKIHCRNRASDSNNNFEWIINLCCQLASTALTRNSLDRKQVQRESSNNSSTLHPVHEEQIHSAIIAAVKRIVRLDEDIAHQSTSNYVFNNCKTEREVCRDIDRVTEEETNREVASRSSLSSFSNIALSTPSRVLASDYCMNGNFLIVTTSPKAAAWLALFFRLTLSALYLRCKEDSTLVKHGREFKTAETKEKQINDKYCKPSQKGRLEKSIDEKATIQCSESQQRKLDCFDFSVATFLNLFDSTTEREITLFSLHEITYTLHSLLHEKVIRSVKSAAMEYIEETTINTFPRGDTLVKECNLIAHDNKILTKALKNILPSNCNIVKDKRSEISLKFKTFTEGSPSLRATDQGTGQFLERCLSKDITVTSLGLVPSHDDTTEIHAAWVNLLIHFSKACIRTLALTHSLHDSQRALTRRRTGGNNELRLTDEDHMSSSYQNRSTARRLILRALQSRQKN